MPADKIITTIAALFLLNGCLQADTLIFPNGDRLTGTILGLNDESIQFESPLLGKITVPAEGITIETSTEAVSVNTADQEAATIMAEAETPPAQTESETAEEVAKEKDAVARFNAAVDRVRDYFNYIVPPGWTGRITFGVSFTETNTSSEDWNFGLRATKDSDRNHYAISTYYQYKITTQTTGGTNRQVDKWGGDFTYKYDINDSWFFQSTSSYLSDAVKDIRHQVTQSFGMGYRIFDTEKLQLSVTPAASVQYKDAGGVSERWIGYATLFESLTYHFNHIMRLEQTANFSMDPSNSNRYLYNFKTAFISKLSDWIESSLSYEINYDNTVGGGNPRNEQQIVFALGVPF